MRRYLIAGLLVWIPLGVTVLVVRLLVDLLDRTLLLLPPDMRPEALLGFTIPGFGILFSFFVVLGTGIVPMTEPETELLLEAPGGLVKARARCRNGKAERITITNVPSFADKVAAPLEVEGLGTLTVDTAYGGDSFVIIDAKALGFEIVPEYFAFAQRRLEQGT